MQNYRYIFWLIKYHIIKLLKRTEKSIVLASIEGEIEGKCQLNWL